MFGLLDWHSKCHPGDLQRKDDPQAGVYDRALAQHLLMFQASDHGADVSDSKLYDSQRVCSSGWFTGERGCTRRISGDVAGNIPNGELRLGHGPFCLSTVHQCRPSYDRCAHPSHATDSVFRSAPSSNLPEPYFPVYSFARLL